MNNKKLLFFTATYPFGKGEAFIENEINYLSDQFDHIFLITNDTTSSEKRSTPSNVTVYRHPYSLNRIQKLKALTKLFSLDFWRELWFVVNVLGVFPTRRIVFTALSSAYKSTVIRRFISTVIGLQKQDTFITYSYWSDDSAVALAMLKSSFPKMKSACRAHRWDVYFNTKMNEYLPYRRLLATNIKRIFFISNHAKAFFISNNRIVKSSSLAISRLGTFPIQRNIVSKSSNTFHLVSCSNLIPRKRVLLLAESLLLIQNASNFTWTHIGDGEERHQLELFIREKIALNPSINVVLKGSIPNQQIRSFYADEQVDLFVNVSSSEGVPVSIMEAMSASIPAIATNVDAVNEIVKNNFNGLLLSPNPTPEEIAGAIIRFMNMPASEREKFKQNAYRFWDENYNAEKNYTDFARQLHDI